MTWLEILKVSATISAIAVPIFLGVLRLWVQSVGDARWAKRGDVVMADGQMRLASLEELACVEEVAEGTKQMHLSQNDKLADHHERLIRLEEADKNVMRPLQQTLEKISNRMDDMGTRMARLEGIPERLISIEKRLDRRLTERDG